MAKKINKQVKENKKTEQVKPHTPLFWTFAILVWGILLTTILSSGFIIFDRKTSYNYLPNHSALVYSNSMSEINSANVSYLNDDNFSPIKKGDVVNIKAYKSYEQINEYDSIAYLTNSGTLNVTRVISKYIDNGCEMLKVRCDASETNGVPVSYSSVKGKITSIVRDITTLYKVLNNKYCLLGSSCAAFALFVITLIVEINRHNAKLGNNDKKVEKIPGLDNKKQVLNYHITRASNGKWMIKISGTSKFIFPFETSEDAVKHVNELLKGTKSVAYLHDNSGKIFRKITDQVKR